MQTIRNIEDLIQEVEDVVDFYYGDVEIEPSDIPLISVEEVLATTRVGFTNLNYLRDRLLAAAEDRYEVLYEHDHF